MSEGKVKVKAEGGNKGEKWSIKVCVEGHDPLQMMVMPTTKTSKLIKAFCDRNGLQPNLVRFLNEQGGRVDPEKTVEENELEDGDTLEGRIEQHGGGAGC